MRLFLGERWVSGAVGSTRSGYVVTGVVAETPWYGLYAGKKIFRNFDFANKRLRETDEIEWGDVFLRAVHYPVLDDLPYVQERRARARSEVHAVLSRRSTNLWPEPVDVLEVTNDRDFFSFASEDNLVAEQEPITVFARPHGKFLAEWLGGAVPLTSLLSVSAELLDLVRHAHSEGLLLAGLGPAAVLVDGSDRIHYVGTDMVIDRRQDIPVRPDEDRSAAAAGLSLTLQSWRRQFPAERLPRGFAAPELVEEPPALPDQRSDLFAWGAVAFFLLSGQSPERIAEEQRRGWAHFLPDHFLRLETSLRAIPERHVRGWAEQLGVDENVLAERWPGGFVELLRRVLHPEPARRPATVEELLQWLDSPPPAPPAAVFALVSGPAQAKIFIDFGTAAGLDMVVRRGVGAPPETLSDGALLAQGPARSPLLDPAVPLTTEPIFYSVFSRRNDSAGPLVSAGACAELTEHSPQALCRWAEARVAFADGVSPSAVALATRAVEEMVLARAWADSALPEVRRWSLQVLAQISSKSTRQEEADALLTERLRDPQAELRLEAARLLLARTRDDDEVYALAHAVGLDDTDAALQAVALLERAGLSAAQARRTRERLEEERPDTCPECGIELTRRERGEHLGKAHGYLDVRGSWTPRPQALERLWDFSLFEGDTAAHDAVVAACAESMNPTAVYRAALEEALAKRWEPLGLPPASQLPLKPPSALAPYLSCLRSVGQGRGLVNAVPADGPTPRTELLAELARSSQRLVRALARETWLPSLGEAWRHRTWTGAELRRELEQVGPLPFEEKILLCRRLPEWEVDVAAVRSCLKLLELEKPVACSECGASVRAGDLERHLRHAHNIYQFRGRRDAYQHIRNALLKALCQPDAEETVWHTLIELARERHADHADVRLATWICHELKTDKSRRRFASLRRLGELLATDDAGRALLPLLVRPFKLASLQPIAKHLALEIAARLGAPPAPRVLSKIKPLLADKETPVQVRQHAAGGLLVAAGQESHLAREILEAFVAQTGKLRAIEKLRRLEERVGNHAAIDELCARLEDQVRMNCPRCGVELRRVEMAKHIWERHGLMLDGRRVREPIRVLEDWIVDYGLEKDAATLTRCRDLARQIDSRRGDLLLKRLLLKQGVQDRAALLDLLARARDQQSALCPHCYSSVPVPVVPEVRRPAWESHQWRHGGFRVELWEGGIMPRLEIDSPQGLVFRGREPGSGLTRTGALALVAGPLTVVGFIIIESVTRSALPALAVLSLALGIGMVLAALVFLLWPGFAVSRDRLIDAAWDFLTPKVLEDLTPEALDMLAGLARDSLGRGDPERRSGVVAHACEKVEEHAGTQPFALRALAELTRLHLADLQEIGGDPVLFLSKQIEKCFCRWLPLSFAQIVLEEVTKGGAFWSKGQLRRLQALLCADAFAAGLELADLEDCARVCPPLAAVLGLGDMDRLMQLQLLWLMRGSQSWQQCGPAHTIFEIAAGGPRSEPLLAGQPDLLIRNRPGDIQLGSKGVWVQDICLTEMPERIEVVARSLYDDPGFDLVIDRHRFYFASPPKKFVEELDRWLAFYFEDFSPQTVFITHRLPQDAGRKLREKNALSCPECSSKLVGRVGEVGLKADT
ncbi:MAG: hypothetical protein L0Y72_00385 [Gemmataceae bacterium]|nr:hypothetical protein [Gemmataceae bacterium]MCI0737467.1 hypothetical protein [Gemmataceae bacterium]